MSRWCRVMLAGLVAVFGVAATCLAGAMYQNTSGTAARAIRIEFSEPAEITSMWPSFPQRDPQGPATVIVLSGGEVPAGGWFSFTWRPGSARVAKIEWLAQPSTTRPNALGILWAAGDFAKHGEQLDRTALVSPSTTPQVGAGLLPFWAWDTPTSSYYRERYANLLDALKRISGTDPEARTDADAFVRGPSEASAKLVRWARIVVDLRDMSTGKSHRYEGITYDIHGSRVVAEIRAIIGDAITTGTAGANVVVSYTTGGKVNRAPPHLDEVSFRPDGQPATGTVVMQGFCRNEDYLLRAFRLAFARLLTLNNALEEAAVLDEGGAFSEDFVAVLRLMYGLPPGHDLAQYKAPRAPVAIAELQTGEPKVGDTIIVDVSASRGLEGAIAGYRLDQVHMGPETLEYRTEWKWEESEYLGERRFRLVAEQPGRYAMKLTAVDAYGQENAALFAVTVAPARPYDWDYTVVNLFDVMKGAIEGLEAATLDFVAAHYNANAVEFVHNVWYTQTTPVPLIDRQDEDTDHYMPLPWVQEVIQEAQHRGFLTILSVQFSPLRGVDEPCHAPKSTQWWEVWLEEIERILVEEAQFAEENHVDVLTVYYSCNFAELTTGPSVPPFVLPGMRRVLERVRSMYTGLIGFTAALTGMYDAPINRAAGVELLRDPNIDIVFLVYYPALFRPDEPEPDVFTLTHRVRQTFSAAPPRGESFISTASGLGKPVVPRLAWTSAHRQNEFAWFEPVLPSPSIARDYASQVRMYEATFAALATPPLSDVFGGVVIPQLLWTDTFNWFTHNVWRGVPVEASGDKATNTRNKPVEALISFIFSHARGAQSR